MRGPGRILAVPEAIARIGRSLRILERNLPPRPPPRAGSARSVPAMHEPARLPPAALRRRLEGRRLSAERLVDVLGSGPALLVFLRQLGCTFCRRDVDQLAALAQREQERFPRLVLVHPATSEEGEAFFAERYPEAIAVADPGHALYRAFGLRRGNAWQLFGPRIWFAAARSLLSGHGGAAPIGDYRVLGGRYVVKDGAVAWGHRTHHAAEEGRWEEMLAVARGECDAAPPHDLRP